MRSSPVGLTVILLLSGCDSGRPQEGGVSAADSVGVRIVENTAPAWSTDERWRLSETPAVEIGAVEGDRAYLFDRIVGAVRLSDRRIAVADMGSSEVRFFDATGEYLMSVGSEGEGPGEFRQLLGLHLLPGGAIAAIDRLESIHVFDSSGAYQGSIQTGTTPLASIDPLTYHENPPRNIRIAGWLEDETFVGWESSQLTFSEGRQFDESQTLEFVFSRYRPDASLVDTIVGIEGPTFHPHPLNLALREVFGPEIFASTDRQNLVLGLSGEGEVRWYDPDAGLLRIARLDWPPRRVTEDMIEEYVSESSPPVSEDVARGRTFAQELAKFSDMIVDREGDVWLRHYDVSHAAMTLQYIRTFDRESTWSVIEPSGRWLGEVTMPARFSPTDIGGDYVLGVYRDDVEVQYVRVYRLRK